MKLKKVRLFPNQNQCSQELALELTKKLEDLNFEVVEENYQLAIAIGGDGSYLRMVRENNFDSEIYYMGINMGTLGFLQEIKPEEIDSLLEKITQGNYKIDSVGVQETTIFSKTEENHFYSLNEIVIRDQDFKTMNVKVFVNDELLECYTGDGLLISTSIGSTAYNISLGGSIVYSDLHTLQITPIAPLNTRAYRDILNSVIIPQDRIIQLIPTGRTKDLMISVDGENYFYHDIQRIETSVSKKRIECLRMKDYDYTKIINDKFLK